MNNMPSPFTHQNTSDTTEYFVFYSDPDQPNPAVSLIELEPGSSIASGQPHHAQFPSADEAEQFAISMGYEVPEVPEVPEPPEP